MFFFFQAEDGIRDKLVTGVQTCALPIWRDPTMHWIVRASRALAAAAAFSVLVADVVGAQGVTTGAITGRVTDRQGQPPDRKSGGEGKRGGLGGRRIIKKKKRRWREAVDR